MVQMKSSSEMLMMIGISCGMVMKISFWVAFAASISAASGVGNALQAREQTDHEER